MSERQRSNHDADALDAVANFGSVPPPNGADPHVARTAVAPLPSQLLEELRAKKNDVTSSRRMRIGPQEGEKWSSEAPTAPGKDSAFFRRPVAPGVEDIPPAMPTDNLVAVVTAALAPATFDPPVFVEEPPPPRSEKRPSPAPHAFAAPAPLPSSEEFRETEVSSAAAPPFAAPIALGVPPTMPSVPAPRHVNRLESLVVLVVVACSGIALGALLERCMHHH
jgi:hypothetical protein